LLSPAATLALFDVGGGELFVLALIALLLYGGELPKVARKVGRVVGDLKRQADNITREWRELDYEDSRTIGAKKPPTRIPPPRQEPVTPSTPASLTNDSPAKPESHEDASQKSPDAPEAPPKPMGDSAP